MRKRHCVLASSISALAILVACGGESATSPPVTSVPLDTAIAPEARSHLSELLDIMQSKSLRRQQVDWSVLRSSTFATARGMKSIAALQPAILNALTLLGDGHSIYTAVDGTSTFARVRNCVSSNSMPPSTLPKNVGYVWVRAFSGTASQALQYAENLQVTIRNADSDSIRGWIVDLRGNGGGSMWPMVAGLGPLLGDGTLGKFIEPDGTTSVWSYRDGASRIDDRPVQSVTDPYVVRRPNPRVAVLVDNAVASSGEATFISFKGRPNTRSFGVATCGLSTANRGFTLANGAVLNLTVAVLADRNGVQAGDQLAPDEVISGAQTTVDRAVAWLLGGG